MEIFLVNIFYEIIRFVFVCKSYRKPWTFENPVIEKYFWNIFQYNV